MLPWQQLNGLIAEAQRVLLISHVRPDGDALGSELAFSELLSQKGKDVEIFNPSPMPTRYAFMDAEPNRVSSQFVGDELPKNTPDLIVVLDTGTWSQLAGLADYVRASKAAKVVIDHHISQDDLGALRLVDTSSAACGMLVYEAFKHLGAEITPFAARSLFCAIAMDTGWMRHSNCSSHVLAALSHLVTAGAVPSDLYRRLFEANRIERLRLLGMMLSRVEIELGGQLAHSYLSFDDILSVHAHPMETEDFINHPMSVKGVRCTVLAIGQREGGTKVSFRSDGSVDCSAIAEEFGGGGHKVAAGASMSLPLAESLPLVLTSVREKMSAKAGITNPVAS